MKMLTMFVMATALVVVPAQAAKGLKTSPVTIDPALGYVLVRIGPTEGKKLKAPPLFLSRYDAVTNDIRTRRKKDPARVPKGEDSLVGIGSRVFLGGDRTSIYLTSLTPGEWVFHGSTKTCLCLGSYRFTVKPGQITDIGTVLIDSEAGSHYLPELQRKPLAADLAERSYSVAEVVFIKAAAESDILPPQVAGLPMTRAELIADARFTNRGGMRYLYNGGILVNRAAGLPAVTSGDGKALVDRLTGASDEKEAVPKPVLEGEEPRPDPDAEATPPTPTR